MRQSTVAQRGLEDGLPAEAGFSPERLQRLSDELKREVEQGLLPGAVTLIARHAKVVHFEAVGWRDRAARAPMSTDAIFRIASMSKPITSVAAMALVEQGRLQLENPVAAYLPRFDGIEVAVPRSDPGGGPPALDRVPAVRPPAVHDLLRHTAGLTYQFFDTPVGRLYREADLRGRDRSNADFASALAALPLAYQPGAGWNYSHATDLLGCVVEVASGRSLLEWEEQEILGPLGMTDTSFWISDPRKHDRVAEAAAPDNRPFGAPLDD
ncbi:MAG: serine hydrolase domain-containing protein, partial [Steroidobacteraceae bacterium]